MTNFYQALDITRQPIACVEPEFANPQTRKFYDKAEERFQDLLNVFKILGHQPEYGQVFTDDSRDPERRRSVLADERAFDPQDDAGKQLPLLPDPT